MQTVGGEGAESPTEFHLAKIKSHPRVMEWGGWGKPETSYSYFPIIQVDVPVANITSFF